MMRKLPGIASDYRGRVQFVAADVTRLGGLRQRYGIKGVPVILFLRGGGVEDKVVGNLPWASMSIRWRIGALLTTEP